MVLSSESFLLNIEFSESNSPKSIIIVDNISMNRKFDKKLLYGVELLSYLIRNILR